jgi:membrane-associated phospholipid phosphatase
VIDSQGKDGPGHDRPPAVSARYQVLAACGVTLLVLAGAFAAYVSFHPGPLAVTADRAWLSLLQHTREPFLTGTVKVLTQIAGPAGGTVIVAIVVVFLWFARHRRIGAVFLATALALTSGASLLIKHLVLRPRPPAPLVPADIGSFPSGNVITTLAVGTALVLVLARPRHRRVPLACVVIATLISAWFRTYLGEHWLSDTLESVLVAACMVLTGWAFAGRYVEAEAARQQAARASKPPPGAAGPGVRDGHARPGGEDLPGGRDGEDSHGTPDAKGAQAGHHK